MSKKYEPKLKEQLEGIVESVSTKYIGVKVNGNWYNIDKKLDKNKKDYIEKVIGEEIFKGDKVMLKVNEEGDFFYIYKPKNKTKKPEEQEVEQVDQWREVVEKKGEIWKKCFNRIHNLAGIEKLPKEDKKKIELFEAILPSVNSLFIETNRELRSQKWKKKK